MNQKIPGPVMAVCAEIISNRETHATLDSLFFYAGAVDEPPQGSKHAKALEWLRITNKNEYSKPLNVLGKLIESYMETPLDSDGLIHSERKDREKIDAILSQYGLQYVKGGIVIGSLGAPSRTLEEFIKEDNLSSIEIEFNRALKNVEASPREAVSAASNILESVCKIYISEENLATPQKQDLKSVWTTVRKNIGFDPSALEDKDLQQILSGIISIVEGIGALRTHASSAHGSGLQNYKLEPRHARLAIHSAHTIALFILETWKKKKSK